MPSKDAFRQAAVKLKQKLDATHKAFMTFQVEEIHAALAEEAGSGAQVKGEASSAEMERALLEEGLIVFPGLKTATDGYIRLYRSGTLIANVLNAIRYPGSGSDGDLAQLLVRVKKPTDLGAPPSEAKTVKA